MDNTETLPSSAAGLPKAAPLPTDESTAAGQTRTAASALVPAKPVAEANDRTGIFVSLVKDDTDIAGLVAYSIYKQNKLDWLRAFEAAKGRVPDEAELSAYIIGEATIRRLATYRHLAEATLAGNGPDVDGSSAARPRPGRRPGPDVATSTLKTGLVVTYLLIAVLFVIILWFAVHSTVASH